ncbi:hypothetical protein cyc_06872 [Cyclospora cayetanensis]|uniref:Uncharacterized protein n=1 Tax=Cyclospora cayetanensis TaxID=88456 RepID=A0A1D3D783_9EIME|nr:hypothetical protein cyc_06872 [Cyclospora cayetanensis]
MLENAKLPLILALLAVSCIIYPTSSQLPPLPTGENEFQEEPGEVETSAPEHVPLKEAIHPGQASVSVIPSTHRVVALPPANVPPEGVMFENKAPSNIQTFQVPGVGLPIEESQQAETEEAIAEEARKITTPQTPQEMYEQALMGEGM